MTSVQTPDQARLSAAREALAAAERAAGASGAVPESESVPSAVPTSPARVGVDDGDGQHPGGGPTGNEAYQAARQVVLRQLAVGPRTRKQLSDKLALRGCDDDVSARVLDRMTEVGLVDDQSFAEMMVRSRQETKGLAAPALRHELRRKGVPDEIAEGALRDVDPHRERAQAEDLVTKRLRTMQGLDREVQTRRLAGFLARKGYSAGVSYEVIRDALDGLLEHRRD